MLVSAKRGDVTPRVKAVVLWFMVIALVVVGPLKPAHGSHNPIVGITAPDASAEEAGQDVGVFRIGADFSTSDVDSIDVKLNLSGSARENQDYLGVDTKVTLSRANATQQITIRPTDDDNIEGTEQVIAAIASDDNYDIDAEQQSATIQLFDNDLPLPTVSVTVSGTQAAEIGSNAGSFTVSLDREPGAAGLTVDYSLTGTATNGTDYQALPGSVNFGPDQRNALIIVAPLSDSDFDEPDPETVIINIASASSYQVGSPSTATVNIAAEPAPLEVSPKSGTVVVGNTLGFSASGGVAPYTWLTSNSRVASIDSNGLLTALAPGSVNLMVTDQQGNSTTTGIIRIVAELSISPTSGTVMVGDTLSFDASGGSIPYVWSTSDPNIATIDSDGLLTGVTPGTVTVTVADQLDAAVSTDVIVVVAALTVSSSGDFVTVGDTLSVNAVGGVPPYAWSTTNPNVATIDDNGLLTAVAPGTTVVAVTDQLNNTASTGRIQVAAPLSISTSGDTATVGDELSFSAAGGVGPYSWRTSDSAIASINNDGVLTALAPGEITVTVTDQRGGTSTTDVIRIVGGLTLSPNSDTVVVGGSLRFNATGGVSPYRWSISDESIAAINPNGVLTAVAPGTVTVTVSDQQNNAVSTGDILVVAALAISAAADIVTVGGTLSFSATGGVAPYAWSTSDPTVATIDNRGFLSAVAPGTITVTVTDQRANTANSREVRVVATLGVSPQRATVAVGNTRTFNATGGVSPYTWRTSDASIARIDNAGLVTGLAPGEVTVSVTDQQGSVAITGAIRIVAALAVSPSRQTLVVGESQNFSASGGVGPYTWSTSDASIAGIDNAGLLTAIAPGEIVVTVTDQQDSTATTELVRVVAALAVSPRSETVVVGNTLRFSVTGGVAPYTWSTSDSNIANISNDGLLTGVTAGPVTVTVTDQQNNAVSTQNIVVVPALTMGTSADIVTVGETLDFSATGGVGPYVWSTSDGDVATIDGSGTLSALSPGTVSVTVTDQRTNTATSGIVRIVARLDLSPLNGAVAIGNTLQFSASGGVEPYTWSISDASIAGIDNGGLLTALAPGEVTVTLTDEQGNTVVTDRIRIVAGLAVSPTSGTVVVGGTLSFSASGGVAPYAWSTSDTDVATIDNSGLLTTVGVGTVTVTITDQQGDAVSTGAIQVVATLAVSAGTAILTVGDTLRVDATGGVEPYDWRTTDDSVARVDGSGELTALAPGEVRVIVSDQQGSTVAETIRIVAGLLLSPTSGRLAVGSTLSFTVTGGVAPYTLSTSDTSIAEVDNNGQLTAVSPGSVVVTVTDELDNTASTDTIEVVEGITISPLTSTVVVGDTLSFNVTGGVPPYGWETTNADVATISNDGVLAALSAGIVNVTVSDSQGNIATSDEIMLVLPAVNIEASDPIATEGGEDVGQFRITIDVPAPSDGLVVNYASSFIDSNSNSDADFEGLPGQATLVAGTQEVTVSIIPIDDAEAEDPEEVTLTLVENESYVLGAETQATITIISDELPQATVSVFADAIANEANSTGAFIINLNRPAPQPDGFTVFYDVSGTAKPGSAGDEAITHYKSLSGNVPIPVGERSAVIIVEPIDNTESDGLKTVILTLKEDPNYHVSSSNRRATVTIEDDENPQAPGAPNAITIQRIDTPTRQTARVDEALSFGVLVVDESNTPVENVALNWTLNQAGIDAGGTFTRSDNATNANGEARASLQTGSFPAAYVVTVRALISDGNGNDVSVSDLFTVNAGLVDVVNPDTPEGAIGVTFDKFCPRLNAIESQLNGSEQALLARCTELYTALSSTNDSDILNALRSIAPEEVAAIGSLSKRLGLRQLHNIVNRLDWVRRGERGLSLSGLTLNISGETLPGRAFDLALDDAVGGQAGDDQTVKSWYTERWGFYITGHVETSDRDETAQEVGFEADTQGVTAGADYRYSNNVVMGGAMGYATTDADLSGGSGILDATNFSLSGYGTYYLSEKAYIDGIVSYGSGDFDMRRDVNYALSGSSVQRTANGSTDSDQFAISLNAGYEFFSQDGFISEVFARLDHITTEIDSYSESGAGELNLAIDNHQFDTMIFAIGGQLSKL